MKFLENHATGSGAMHEQGGVSNPLTFVYGPCPWIAIVPAYVGQNRAENRFLRACLWPSDAHPWIGIAEKPSPDGPSDLSVDGPSISLLSQKNGGCTSL